MFVSLTKTTIREAERRVRPYIRRTPVIEVERVLFKLEFMQHAGSFKTRGAFANLLLRRVPRSGVVAASGGNHGAAVAFAAMRLGVPAKIFVPTVASPAKIAKIRSYGADLVVQGERYADALEASEAWVAKTKAMPIHAFDQAETLIGQGTLGMEVQAQAPQLDTLLVAVGGGGLIGGIASWYRGAVRLIGVEPRAAPTLSKALQAGHPVDAEAGGIAADSLAPRRVGELVYPIVARFVEKTVLVEDAAILQAQKTLWETLRIVVEPGGAAPYAALISRAFVPKKGERVGVVLSGANTTVVNFA